MADICAVYTIATPGGNIVINDDTAPDFLLIDSDGGIDGLDDPEVRTVFKPRPQTDAAYIGPAFLSGYRITFNGLAVVRSTDPYGDVVGYRAAMRVLEGDLRTKLRSMLQADGTMTWENYSLGSIRYDSAVAFSGNMIKHRFVFGISSAESEITVGT